MIAHMKTRTFNRTGYAASEIGLGCWQFGGDWGEVSDEEATRTLAAAVEAGINFVDTADVYGAGRSETLIGRFLKNRNLKGKVFVATKLGRLHGYPDDYCAKLFRRCTEDSLQRLGVDALDLLQLHCVPRGWLERGEVFDWLSDLKRECKVRHFGASVESMDEADLCLRQEGLASLQIIFNIFRQKPIESLFEKARSRDVALVIRLPLASGLLAGKFDKNTTFPEVDHRNYNRDGQMFNVGETFAGLPFEKGVDATEKVRAIFNEAGLLHGTTTMAQLAQRWILDHDAVSVVITGSKRPQQVRENAAGSDLPPLGDDVHRQLAAYYREDVADAIRGPY